jgi:hypothetical protein
MWAPLKNTSAAETSGNKPGSGADVTTEALEKLKLSSPKPKNVGSVPVMTTDWMSAALLWKPKKSGPEPAGTLGVRLELPETKLKSMVNDDPINMLLVSKPSAAAGVSNVTVNGAEPRPRRRESRNGVGNDGPVSILKERPGTIGAE